jgi:hypothetical protein
MPIAPGPIAKYFMDGHLIVLRKLLSQKSEHERENDGVDEGSRWAGLSGGEDTLGAWWQSEQHTWAQDQEQSGGHDEVGLGENETHSLRDHRVHEEEHEGVEQDRGSTGETVAELDAGAIGSEDDTWAKREEEGGWDGNFLGSDIWKHVYIISYYNSMALSSEKR